MFNKSKKHAHEWETVPTPIVIEGRIYVVEKCKECNMYQYVKVPSNRMRRELEKSDN